MMKAKKNVLIVYHRDLDGLASALIAQKYYFEQKNVGKIELQSIQHGEQFDILDKLNFSCFVLLDFSFDNTTMSNIYSQVDEFVWIDHHKSARDLELWKSDVMGKRSLKESACVLTWQYFYTHPMPYSVRLIGDYDIWRFRYGDDTRAYIEFLSQFDIDDDIQQLSSCILRSSISSTDYATKRCISQGEPLLRYREAIVKKLYKKGTQATWNGIKTFVCNATGFHPYLADYALKQNPDIEIVNIYQFKWDGEKWITTHSLVSRGKVDVAEIAERYGGGGHHNASGFVVEPFKGFEHKCMTM